MQCHGCWEAIMQPWLFYKQRPELIFIHYVIIFLPMPAPLELESKNFDRMLPQWENPKKRKLNDLFTSYGNQKWAMINGWLCQGEELTHGGSRPSKCLNHHNQQLCKIVLAGVNVLLQTYGVVFNIFFCAGLRSFCVKV